MKRRPVIWTKLDKEFIEEGVITTIPLLIEVNEKDWVALFRANKQVQETYLINGFPKFNGGSAQTYKGVPVILKKELK